MAGLFEITGPTGRKFSPPPNRYWRCNEQQFEKWREDGRIWWGIDGDARPMLKAFLSESTRGITPNTWWDYRFAGHNKEATLELKELFNGSSPFDTPKPVRLLKRIIELASDRDSVIMDFFAGSAPLAQAIMELNTEDNGRRRYIAVQLPEPTDTASGAHRAGYPTIADVAKDRIRRAGQKLKSTEGGLGLSNLDIGFRVLKIDTSNMNEVYYTPDAVTQEALPGLVDNIRADRSAEDLLFQVLLDWGVGLTWPISQKVIAGKTVFFVDGNALAACFEAGIDEDFVKQLAAHKPLRVVFRDAGFVSDSVKINVEQVFKLLSPATEIKTL